MSYLDNYALQSQTSGQDVSPTVPIAQNIPTPIKPVVPIAQNVIPKDSFSSATLSSDTIDTTVIPQNKEEIKKLAEKGNFVDETGTERDSTGKPVEQKDDSAIFLENLAKFNKLHGRVETDSTGIKKTAGGGLDTTGVYDDAGNIIGATKVPTAQDTADAESTKAEDEIIAKLQSTLDAQTKRSIDEIKVRYDLLRSQQEQINKGAEAAIGQSLLMSGSSRYAQISATGIDAQKRTAGLRAIAALDAEEQSLINQALATQDAGEFQLLEKQLGLIKEKRTEKQAAAKELNDAIKKQNEKLKEQQTAMIRDIGIAELIKSGKTGLSDILSGLAAAGINATIKDVKDAMDLINADPTSKGVLEVLKGLVSAPPEVIDAVSNSKSVGEAIKNAGAYYVSKTGTVGEWQTENANRASQGLPSISWDTYATEDQNRKIRVAAASQNADRILSATEAQALGVPFGTTARQAYGQAVTKPPTDAQSRDGLYASRMYDANPILETNQEYITSRNSALFAKDVLLEDTTIGNPLVPNEIRQTRQAERNFLNAVLRRESGAVISPSEFANGAKQYFARPGDDSKTLTQKKQNRDTALKQLIKSAGPAFGGEISTPSALDSAAEKDQNAISAIQSFHDVSDENAAMLDSIRSTMPDASPTDIQEYLKEKGYIQ